MKKLLTIGAASATPRRGFLLYNARKLMAAVAVAASAMTAMPSWAGLVARWDFNNYDPENPRSAAILAPTVGNLAAIPCSGNGTSTAITDGTLGNSITVVGADQAPGLADGDYALNIPSGSHLKMPLPAGIVRDKEWMVRIRFYVPAGAGHQRSLIQPDYGNAADKLYFVNGYNLIRAREAEFGTSQFENKNNYASSGADKNKDGALLSRTVTTLAWHSFTAHFGAAGSASTLDGVRSVSLESETDLRSSFTGDGFILCGDKVSDGVLYISSVEVWDDMPLYHCTGYLQTSSTKVFGGCSLDDIRDMYLSIRRNGGLGVAGRPAQGLQRIVTSDGNGAVTDLKVDFRSWGYDHHILADFTDDGTDVYGYALRAQHSLGFSFRYFTDEGGFSSEKNVLVPGTTADASGTYSAYNLYALPFTPLKESMEWGQLMGSGIFGNPVISLVADGLTLTFDAQPKARSLTLDCGRGEGYVNAAFAYSTDALKTMASFGSLNIGEGVALTIPADVSITGAVAFAEGSSLVIDMGNAEIAPGTTVFTAAGGFSVPAGKSVADFVSASRGNVIPGPDGKTLVMTTFAADVPISAEWTGGGDRNNVSDPQNWLCRNYAGNLLAGAIPGENTSVSVSGATTFNVPTGQVLTCYSLTIGDCTLSENCDWRGLGTGVMSCAAGNKIDLNGHWLVVAGLDAPSATTVTNGNTSTLSEFYVDVAANAASVNSNVRIGGNLRFIKEGAGNYIAEKTNQGYTGGTLVSAGTIICATRGQNCPTGASGSTIEIGPDGVFDVDGCVAYHLYAFVLNGGVLKSSRAIRETDWTMWSNVRLTADSIIELGGNYGFAENAYGRATLDLGGNRLTVKLNSSSVYFQLYNTQILNGSIENTSGGYIRVYNTSGDSGSSTFDFKAAIALNLERALVVRDYEPKNKWTGSNEGTGVVKVHRVFKPTAAAEGCYHSCQMQNGSTMDLTDWPSDKGWPMYSRFTSGGNQLSFANGTVNVKLDSTRADVRALAKTKSDGAYAGYLLKWGTTAGTLATRNAGTTFVLDADSAVKYKLRDDGTGLLLLPKCGFRVIVQ